MLRNLLLIPQFLTLKKVWVQKLPCPLGGNVPVPIYLTCSVITGNCLEKVCPWRDTSVAHRHGFWMLSVNSVFCRLLSREDQGGPTPWPPQRGKRYDYFLSFHPCTPEHFVLNTTECLWKIAEINWGYGCYFPTNRISFSFWAPRSLRIGSNQPNPISDRRELNINYSVEGWSISVSSLFLVHSSWGGPTESLASFSWHLWLHNFEHPFYPSSSIRLLKVLFILSVSQLLISQH